MKQELMFSFNRATSHHISGGHTQMTERAQSGSEDAVHVLQKL